MQTDLMLMPLRAGSAIDVMSNRVRVHFGAVSIMLPSIKDGRMRDIVQRAKIQAE